MGWKEKGKYGVSTGRTVRSPFAAAHGFFSSIPRRETETLLKFTRGTEKFSNSELDEFLTENDIGDGLRDFAESSRLPWNTRNSTVHRSSVPYSLKKRKRWRLSELAEENSVELNDSLERPNVTFIHRRLPNNLDADCIAIQKTKQNEVLTPRKHRYSRVQDLLKKCDKIELEPEIGYEISYRYPTNEYPECGEGHCFRDRWSYQWSLRNPRKARWKNKGIKNKGYRWDVYSDGEVKSGKVRKNQPCHVCEVQVDDGSYIESKVQVIDAESFNEWKAADKRSFTGGASFDLGCYIEELTKYPKNHRIKSGCSTEDQSLKGSFIKYGKKNVVYIDPEVNPDLSHDQDASNSSSSAASKPQILQPEKKAVVTLLLNAGDVEPENLKAQWNDLYNEANSLPRKFMIDLIPLLSAGGTFTNESCHVLFEVTKKADNGLSSATTDVSLHVAETRDLDSNSACNTSTKFYSEIESVKQDILRVQDVVDYAIHCLQDCCQPLLYVTCTPNSPKHAKGWRSVEVLGSMFGWKSDVYTQTEIKSELRFKLKEQRLHCGTDQLDEVKTEELLDKFCGICYEELG